MQPATSYIDPCVDQFTPDILSKTRVDRTNGVTRLALETLKPASSGGWMASVMGGLTKLVKTDPKDIHVVARAIDELAAEELRTGVIALGDDLKTKLQKVDKQLARLKKLEENLKAHDTVIANTNKTYYTNLWVCSDHSQILGKIAEKRQNLEEMRASLIQDRNIERIVNIITQLKTNIAAGQKIDRDFVAESYPAFMAKLTKAKLPKDLEARFRNQYVRLVNKAYVSNLIQAIQTRTHPFPQSVVGLLRAVGTPKDTILTKINQGAPRLLEVLRKLESSENMMSLESPHLVDTIQRDFIGLVIQSLALPPGIASTFKQLHDLEVEWTREHRKARDEVCDVLVSLKEQDGVDPEMLPYYLDKFKARPAPSFVIILELIFKELKADAEVLKPDKLEAFNKALSALITKKKPEILSGVLTVVSKEMQAVVAGNTAWFERNRENCLFRFSQIDWGMDHILGRGCCGAINYRWCKGITHNPTKKFSSADQLDSKPAVSQQIIGVMSDIQEQSGFRADIERKAKVQRELQARKEAAERAAGFKPDVEPNEWGEQLPVFADEKDQAGVTAHDRKIQAEWSLRRNVDMDVDAHQGIPATIVTKDGFRKELIVLRKDEIDTIPKLVKLVVDRNDKGQVHLNQSHGVLDVTITQAVRDPWGSLTAFQASHATGMQIDIPTGTYRFWDVNFGMFSYDKLETMVQAYSEFLHDFYDGKYNDFVVTQYVPVTASNQF